MEGHRGPPPDDESCLRCVNGQLNNFDRLRAIYQAIGSGRQHDTHDAGQRIGQRNHWLDYREKHAHTSLKHREISPMLRHAAGRTSLLGTSIPDEASRIRCKFSTHLAPFPLASFAPNSLINTPTLPSPTPSFPSSNPGLTATAKYLPSPLKLSALTLATYF